MSADLIESPRTLVQAGGSPRVLVIDDSAVLAQFFCQSLSGQGWEVRPVTGAHSGIALASDWPPDVVVCDLHMPDISGFEVMKAFREIDATIPVIILTRDDDVETVLNAIHEGVFDFVRKQSDAGVLVASVSRAIDHVTVVRDNHRLARELRSSNQELERRVLERTTALEESLQALHTSEARFRSLVQNASDIIAVINTKSLFLYASPSIQRVLGHEPSEILGRRVFQSIHPDDLQAAEKVFEKSLAAVGIPHVIKLRFVHKDASVRWLEVRITNHADNKSVGGVVWNCRDITEAMALEQQLRHEASHDPLTQLANRALLRQRLDKALTEPSTECVSVIFIDLNGFKAINDRLGHAVGDALLVAVAARIRTCIRDVDLAARLGGDEFAVVMERLNDADAQRVAERIHESISVPIAIHGQEVTVKASIGIATSTGTENVDDLLRSADLAMYSAKARRNTTYEVYHSEMHRAMVERIELETELRAAIESKTLVLNYQPIVNLDTGEIVGAEALLRWRHPVRGIVGPQIFIPIAEETGLIVPIGCWVLDAACASAKKWQDAYARDFIINVNVSPRQLRHPDFIAEVKRSLYLHAIPPSTLTLEITENIALEEREPVLVALKKLGVRLAIDDFGSGYSSLGYLQRLDVDTIKIDKSFVDPVGTEGQDDRLARAVIQLGRGLGVATTAEGIETLAQARLLRSLGCDYGQGYFFSRPIPEADIPALLEKRVLNAHLDDEIPCPAPALVT